MPFEAYIYESKLLHASVPELVIREDDRAISGAHRLCLQEFSAAQINQPPPTSFTFSTTGLRGDSTVAAFGYILGI